MGEQKNARRVTVYDLDYAVEWLRVNEGPDEERTACHMVAEWLEVEISRRADAAAARFVAKQAGVSVPQARAAIARAKGE